MVGSKIKPTPSKFERLSETTESTGTTRQERQEREVIVREWTPCASARIAIL
jgi:hypothetical protein